jgi:hypothetical protein
VRQMIGRILRPHTDPAARKLFRQEGGPAR